MFVDNVLKFTDGPDLILPGSAGNTGFQFIPNPPNYQRGSEYKFVVDIAQTTTTTTTVPPTTTTTTTVPSVTMTWNLKVQNLVLLKHGEIQHLRYL